MVYLVGFMLFISQLQEKKINKHYTKPQRGKILIINHTAILFKLCKSDTKITLLYKTCHSFGVFTNHNLLLLT